MIQGEEQVIQSAISTSDSGYLISAFPFSLQQDNYPTYLNVFKLDRLGNRVWAHSFSRRNKCEEFLFSYLRNIDGMTL